MYIYNVYIYILYYTLRRVPGWSWWSWYWCSGNRSSGKPLLLLLLRQPPPGLQKPIPGPPGPPRDSSQSIVQCIYIYIYSVDSRPGWKPGWLGWKPRKTCENLRTTWGAAPYLLLSLGLLRVSSPGFHPGRLSTLYVCVYIYIYI